MKISTSSYSLILQELQTCTDKLGIPRDEFYLWPCIGGERPDVWRMRVERYRTSFSIYRKISSNPEIEEKLPLSEYDNIGFYWYHMFKSGCAQHGSIMGCPKANIGKKLSNLLQELLNKKYRFIEIRCGYGTVRQYFDEKEIWFPSKKNQLRTKKNQRMGTSVVEALS